MHICWKSFFLSFGAAILLFSLLMTGICIGVFNKFVPEAEHSVLSQPSDFLADVRASYESYIFYCNDKDGKELDFALLVRVNEKEKKLLVTNLGGDNLLERRGELFYIRSLCQTYGKQELSPIFAALTGYQAPIERILNVRDYVPQAEKHATVRYLDFLEILPEVMGQAKDDFLILECPLVIEEVGEVKILNIEKSLETFLSLK